MIYSPVLEAILRTARTKCRMTSWIFCYLRRASTSWNMPNSFSEKLDCLLVKLSFWNGCMEIWLQSKTPTHYGINHKMSCHPRPVCFCSIDPWEWGNPNSRHHGVHGCYPWLELVAYWSTCSAYVATLRFELIQLISIKERHFGDQVSVDICNWILRSIKPSILIYQEGYLFICIFNLMNRSFPRWSGKVSIN